MLPSLSTDWSGIVTKLPGRTPASDGINKPPAAASKIVTVTTSPMPNLILDGGTYLSGNTPASPLGSKRPTIETVSGVSLTNAYGRCEPSAGAVASALN